jgi:hypothetical protein
MRIAILFIIGFMVTSATFSWAETTTFNCEYLSFSDESGSHTVSEPLRFSLLLDSGTKKAYLVGNGGASEIVYRANSDRLTFIEETASGNILVTVISSGGQSVHSRHPSMGDKFLASQYYGKCSKK